VDETATVDETAPADETTPDDETATDDETSTADETPGDDEASDAERVPATTRRSGWPAWAWATRIKVPLAEKHASPLAATPDTALETAPETAPLPPKPNQLPPPPDTALDESRGGRVEAGEGESARDVISANACRERR
jgi:hypothetical protein